MKDELKFIFKVEMKFEWICKINQIVIFFTKEL